MAKRQVAGVALAGAALIRVAPSLSAVPTDSDIAENDGADTDSETDSEGYGVARREPARVGRQPQLSGWRPSISVNPYVLAICVDVTECWFHRARSGSAARATTARPTKRGDSDSANNGGAAGFPSARSEFSASRQWSSACAVGWRRRRRRRGRAERPPVRGPSTQDPLIFTSVNPAAGRARTTDAAAETIAATAWRVSPAVCDALPPQAQAATK